MLRAAPFDSQASSRGDGEAVVSKERPAAQDEGGVSKHEVPQQPFFSNVSTGWATFGEVRNPSHGPEGTPASLRERRPRAS
jgi:hypothetical protein